MPIDKNKSYWQIFISQFAGLCQPVGTLVKEKIKELVSDGVSKVSEVKRHLDIFMKNEVVENDESFRNRRFHRTDKDIRNHIEIGKVKIKVRVIFFLPIIIMFLIMLEMYFSYDWAVLSISRVIW